MSVADGVPDILLPADPRFRETRDREARASRLRRGAIVAAALAHIVVIGAVVARWPALFAEPIEQPPIPVTLVMEAPAPAAPRALPAPPPPAPAQERVSGPDSETTTPKAAETGAEAAPKPSAPPLLDTPSQRAAPVPKPEPAPELHPPKPKLATRETAPKPARGSVNRPPGETERAGDPYLNRLWGMIEEHRTYPPNAVGSLGLQLEGTTVYVIAIAANGALTGVKLERSSGAEVLDQTALKMIEEAAPFPPPPPSEFPGPGAILEVTIHLYPGAG